MKHLTLTLKSSDLQDTGQFEGYASTFGNVDQGGDLIEPGAFRESVAKARAEGWGMPPIRTPWIIDHLMDLGPSEAGAMGSVPISWASIDHWQRCSGLDLSPWISRLLRRLSVDFIAETVRAREPDCPPPWTATSSLNRDEVSRKVTNAFRALMIPKEPNP